jgi:large subunit ribosomal protein L31
MTLAIHPPTYRTVMRCGTCGTEHELRSTRERLAVETCSSCHPAYVGGTERTARGDRIARFEARRARAAA